MSLNAIDDMTTDDLLLSGVFKAGLLMASVNDGTFPSGAIIVNIPTYITGSYVLQLAVSLSDNTLMARVKKGSQVLRWTTIATLK